MEKFGIKEIAGRLSGKRIVLGGAGNPAKEFFRQEILRAVQTAGDSCTVLDGTEHARKDDYAVLFSDADSDGSVPVQQQLLEEMARLCTVKPASVLLVSDAGVYGRFYGDGKPRKEAETGYVGHTRPEDIPLQRLRLTEHMACRLAREEGLPVKIVRMSRKEPELYAEAAEPAEFRAGNAMPERLSENRTAAKTRKPEKSGAAPEPVSARFLAAAKVLLNGKNGEIYNLPEREADETECQELSPLSPRKLRMDTGKVEKLSCCETI